MVGAMLGLLGCDGESSSGGQVADRPTPVQSATSKPAGRARGTVVVYASLPAHGPSKTAGNEVALGMRHALTRAGGRAGQWRVRLAVLASTRAVDRGPSATAVRSNARRAARDRRAVAYVGELDGGSSAFSLPTTRRAKLVQVSPTDGLTSLGRALPTSARDLDPPYYVPSWRSNLVRLVPPDLDAAREASAQLQELGVRRLVVLGDGSWAGYEFAALVLGGLTAEYGSRPAVRRLRATEVARIGGARPDVILYPAVEMATAHSVIRTLADRLPDVPVIGGPGLAAARPFAVAPRGSCAWSGVPEPEALPPRGRALLSELRTASGQDDLHVTALLGHAAMDLLLDAIAIGGRDRRAVAAAARQGLDRDDVTTGHGLGTRAHVEGESVVCVPLGATT